MALSVIVVDKPIENLTGEVITVYDSSGDLLRLEPKATPDNEDCYFLLLESDVERFENIGKENIVLPCHKGIGRDGVEVTILIRCSDKARIIPWGI